MASRCEKQTECDTFCVMKVTQKRTAARKDSRKRSKRPSKRAGGQMGDGLRRRLAGLVERAGSLRRFAEILYGDLSAKDPRAPRVREWIRGRNLPAAESLRLIADKFDVSVDWLLGFEVPERRTDRERVGDLALALSQYVARDYDRRAERQRRDGLAAAMGGKLVDVEPPRPSKPGEPWPDPPSPGDALSDGRIVTHQTFFSGLRVLDVDPQVFLGRVCDSVFRDAEAWEEAHQEDERTAVRDSVAELLADFETVVKAMGGERESVYRDLINAALDPLNTHAQSGIIGLGRMRRQHVQQQAAWNEAMDGIIRRAVEELHLNESQDSANPSQNRDGGE